LNRKVAKDAKVLSHRVAGPKEPARHTMRPKGPFIWGHPPDSQSCAFAHPVEIDEPVRKKRQLFAGSQPCRAGSLAEPGPDTANFSLRGLCALSERSERAVQKSNTELQFSNDNYLRNRSLAEPLLWQLVGL